MTQRRLRYQGRRLIIIGAAAAATSLSVVGTASSAPNCSGRVDPAQAAKCAHKSATSTKAPLRSFISANPETQPPLHGTLPHGQGTVAVLQLNPDAARPYSNDPAGSGAGSSAETLVVGRARGEQRADGTYHGHITIAAIAGNEILGVDTNPGESKTGPLTALQQQVLNALCTGSGNQICLQAVVANSTTTTTGSTNHFETAHATLGPAASGIDVGTASSDGNITQANGCQTSTGASSVASVSLASAIKADAVQSSTVSNAGTCGGAAPQTNTSKVINLNGTGIPIPAPGCANGTPNTVTSIPMLLDLVCNADDNQGSSGPAQGPLPYGVREALDAFLLASAGVPPLIPPTAAAKLATGAAESLAVAPAPTPTPPTTGPTGPTGPTGTPCNVGGDDDCATSNPNGPALPEGGAADTARDCASGSEASGPCPGSKGNGKNAGGRCNTGGDNDCANGAGPFGPKIPENGATNRARDCAEGVTSEGKQNCAGPANASAQTRSTLPFTG